uniref:ITPR-interacting domain-containing protein n=1 Tax=Periophthalmus magnuspinnatus TaxID=409849 RepID=A0A3B3ZHB0_9GOBI
DTGRKVKSSVAEVLQLYSEKAEETLYELGFGSEDPQVTVRIPPRFFTFPSQAKGINFRLFLDAQIQRIREEDPSLSLASRFRQVQVLTTMANVFYSLYSHVSRTPVQKLPTPEFNFSTPIERMERFRSSIRSDPRSPVDKLKDTVSKMCLYSGSNREYDSPLPSPNKRVSLPDIVDIKKEQQQQQKQQQQQQQKKQQQQQQQPCPHESTDHMMIVS